MYFYKLKILIHEIIIIIIRDPHFLIHISIPKTVNRNRYEELEATFQRRQRENIFLAHRKLIVVPFS